MKKLKAYAVVNTDLGEICLTGHMNDDPVAPDLIDTGKAIFDTKTKALEYRRTFPPDEFIKIIPVMITQIKKKVYAHRTK